MNVLIAVDDSPESREAVEAAYRFFGHDANYSIISVGERPPIFVGGYGSTGIPTATDVDQLLAAARASSEHAVSAAQSALPEPAEIDIEVGSPGSVICEYAAEHRSDVVVIGSHHRSFWERIIDPSVGRHLVEHAPCPVLVVRSGLA